MYNTNFQAGTIVQFALLIPELFFSSILTNFAFLKKSIAIFFLVLYALTTTEAKHLFKLPVVFAHYHEHQQQDPDISVLRFLAIHYLNSNSKDHDYERDQQLPFKNEMDCISVGIPDFVPLAVHTVITVPVKPFIRNYLPKGESFFFSSFLSRIWQPPRAC
jgi:hypothetical protein